MSEEERWKGLNGQDEVMTGSSKNCLALQYKSPWGLKGGQRDGEWKGRGDMKTYVNKK